MKTSHILILKKNTLAQGPAVKSAFCVLYVPQRRLLALSLVIMAGVRVCWEKQLAGIPLSFK